MDSLVYKTRDVRRCVGFVERRQDNNTLRRQDSKALRRQDSKILRRQDGLRLCGRQESGSIT